MIVTRAQGYWTAMKRFNQNRNNPLVTGVTVRSMRRIAADSPSEAIRRRVNKFIGPNQVSSLSDGPDDSGPRLA